MESILGILNGKRENEKIEVLMERTESSTDCVQLRLLSWGEGVGWYPQKTIVFDCNEIGALQSILKQAEALIKQGKQKSLDGKVAEITEKNGMGKILPFPQPRLKKAVIERRALKEA